MMLRRLLGLLHVATIATSLAAAYGAGVVQVLNHSVTKKANKKPPAGLTGIDTVQWGVMQLRHCLSHEVGSHSTLLVS